MSDRSEQHDSAIKGDPNVSAPIPDRVTSENINRFVLKPYKKTTTTRAVGPVCLEQETVVDVKGQDFTLHAGWWGYFALDSEGDVYPIDQVVFEASFQEETE